MNDQLTKSTQTLFPGQKIGKIRVVIKKQQQKTEVQERFALFDGDLGFSNEV